MSYELKELKALSIKATIVVVITSFHTLIFLPLNPGVYPFYALSLFSLPKLAGKHTALLATIWKNHAH